MLQHSTEAKFELTSIVDLKLLGYQHVFIMEIVHLQEEDTLKVLLHDWLVRRHPNLLYAAIQEKLPHLQPPEWSGYAAFVRVG